MDDESRYFTTDDETVENVIVPLPKAWWSRIYEYAWCLKFLNGAGTVLDAACGICHPFKFYAAQRSTEMHACDLDHRINSDFEIQNDISKEFGQHGLNNLRSDRLNKLQANLTNLPYKNNMFDTIFCISTLEHMSEISMALAFLEFKRCIKPYGKIVLTFDVPTITPHKLFEMIQASGLHTIGEVDLNLPENAIQTSMYGGLYCFRTILSK